MRGLVLTMAVLAVCSGCWGHGPLPVRVARRVDRLAVFVRLTEVPVVWLARGDPQAAAEHLEGDPVDIDARMEGHLAQALTLFELEELLRAELAEELDAWDGWEVAPALEVSTALGSLLVREVPPDYSRLAGLEIDAALDVAITGWGVWDDGPRAPAGPWLEIEATLLSVPDQDRLWRARVEVNRSLDPGGRRPIDLSRLADAPRPTLRSAVASVVRDTALRLVEVMGVPRFPVVGRPPRAVE